MSVSVFLCVCVCVCVCVDLNAFLITHGNSSLPCVSCGLWGWNMYFNQSIITTWLLVHTDITLCCFPYLSSLCHAVYDLFIHRWAFCCCVFVSFLVVSGKLKCHPSPIHRPDRDRKLSQPPSIHLPSLLHPPISTHVSVVMGNSDKRTLMGKNMLSFGPSKVKPHHFILLFAPFYALPNTPSYSWTDYVCISNDSFQIAFISQPLYEYD